MARPISRSGFSRLTSHVCVQAVFKIINVRSKEFAHSKSLLATHDSVTAHAPLVNHVNQRIVHPNLKSHEWKSIRHNYESES